MKVLWGLGADVWYGDVLVGGVLYDIMVVVSDYSVWRFLGYLRLMSEVSRGLNCRDDMVLLKKLENTDILSMTKIPDGVHVVLKYGQMKTYHP